MDFKSYTTLIWIVYLFPTWSYDLEVQLVDGQMPNQGRVMVRDKSNRNSIWKPLCSQGFDNNAAAVVCRQLGYRYSLNESQVFKPEIPDWIVDRFLCHGNESRIGDCFKSPHSCFYQDDFYASVCCSNSADFGEWNDREIFNSHCANTWLASQKRCESLGSSLTIFTKERRDLLYNTSAKYVWNGQFFTPWIWSDDCVRFTRHVTTDITDTDISHNFPGICFQICGQEPGTSFALSGHTCRCIINSEHIAPVKPMFCRSKCPGNTDKYCGDGRNQFWDMYRIGSKDDEFSHYSSLPNDTRQCAGLIRNSRQNYKLRSQKCYGKVGFICSEFKNKSERGYIPFPSQRLSLSEARQYCRNSVESWKLAGSDVITAAIYANEVDGLWVDIESSLVPIYSFEGLRVSNTIDPDRCQAVRLTDFLYSGMGSKILDCRKERLLYSCSRTGSSQTSRWTKGDKVSHDTPTKTPTVDLDDGTKATKYMETSADRKTKEIKIWQVTIAVLIALLISIAFVVIFVCWKARKRRSRRAREATAALHNDLNTGGDWTALSPSSRTSGFYQMIPDNVFTEARQDDVNQPPSVYEQLTDRTENVYSELITDRNEQAAIDTLQNGAMGKKESLKLKASYATPHDSVKEKLAGKKI